MPKYLLTLDGGGVRGISQAVFLYRLEEAAGFPIRELFDCLSGTSVGAILVCGLTYNETLTADIACNKLFTHENANKMMPATRFDKILDVLQHQPKYDGLAKTQLIHEYIPDIPLAQPPRGNIVSISAYDCGRGKPVFFKSWDPQDKKRFVSARVAADVSSAAPCYYPSVGVKDGLPPGHVGTQHDMEVGCDGGLFANNCCDSAYADMLKLWGKNEDIIIVSIGNGYRAEHPVGNLKEVKKNVTNLIHYCFGEKEEVLLPGEITKTWGGIEWIIDGDLINVLQQSPQKAVDYRVKAFSEALGHTYIRVDTLNEHYAAPDNASKKNYDNLRALGEKFWVEYGDKVLQLLQPRINDLKAGRRRSMVINSAVVGNNNKGA
jgi:patatin-like phospholipase/acyl hydrolase